MADFHGTGIFPLVTWVSTPPPGFSASRTPKGVCLIRDRLEGISLRFQRNARLSRPFFEGYDLIFGQHNPARLKFILPVVPSSILGFL